MRRVFALLLSSVLLAATPAARAGSLTAKLPPPGDTPAWKLAEPPREVAGQDLFELIDGGAELYQEFGFRRAVAARYEGGNAATLQVEIYEMNTAAAAYGVFSMMQSATGTPVDAGQAARVYDEYLLLWQGAYFVSFVASGRGADTRRELTTLARAVAHGLGEPGQRPKLLDQLPTTGRQDAKYFRGPVALSNLYAFGSGNVFGVREGVFGAYAAHRLFIFPYADAAEARERLRGAVAKLAADPSYRELRQTASGFECVDSDGNRISATTDESRITVRITPRINAVPATPDAPRAN